MPNYAVIPDFSQYTEYITQGPLVDGVYSVVINRAPLDTLINPTSVDGQPVNKLPTLQ